MKRHHAFFPKRSTKGGYMPRLVKLLDKPAKLYEEGAWVPSGEGAATYTTQSGTYTKVGRGFIVFGPPEDLKILRMLGT